MINWSYARKILAGLAVVGVLMWGAWRMGIRHAIVDSYIYEENGYYVIELDRDTWLHFAPDAVITNENNGWK